MRRRPPRARRRRTIRFESRFRDLTDSSLHFYTAERESGPMIRFLVIHQTERRLRRALDACQICGPSGYRQEGQNVICRNCGASIYVPVDWPIGRLQSHPREIERGRRSSDRGSFGACKRRLDHSLLNKMFARLVSESFVRNPAAQNSHGRRARGGHGRRHRDANCRARSGRPAGARVSQPRRESDRHAAIGYAAR